MTREAVFYFDVLGFRQMAESAPGGAVDALSDLAAALSHEQLFPGAQTWGHRYALGDSVFLTHADASAAIEQASDLVFNLFQFNRARPFLIRGAVAYGEVEHVKGIFPSGDETANLVGPGVVQAIVLEQTSGLKGPRILLSENLAKGVAASLREWLLRATSTPGVWEVLWLLPSNPSAVAECEDGIRGVCETALDLLPLGGHATAGAHYREFVLLAARALERLRRFVREGRVQTNLSLKDLLPAGKLKSILSTTSGLPEEYVSSVTALVESLNAS